MPRESIANKKIRVGKIIRRLKKQYPDAHCSLDFDNVHQLMVATILSAQCTDERVNMTTPALFKKYSTIKAFAKADIKELEQLVYATGFYKNKAKSIRNSAQQLLELYDGNMPKTIDELVELSGVGRKTASVILGAGFGMAEGVVVDTHVTRISNLLGLTKEKDAVKIERDLIKILPQKNWISWSHELISHGRATCIARRPQCVDCCLNNLCPSAKK